MNMHALSLCTLSLILPSLSGLIILLCCLRDRAEEFDWPELITSGFALGTGIIVWLLFNFSLFDTSLSSGVGITTAFFLLVIFVYIARLKIKSRPETGGFLPNNFAAFRTGLKSGIKAQSRPGLVIAILLSLWIALKVSFVFFEDFNRPVFAFDSFVNWAGGAKFFFYNNSLVLDPSKEHFLGSGYRMFLGHPLYIPLLQVWISNWTGGFHEVYVKAPGAFYFLGILVVLFYELKKECGLMVSLLTVFFLAGSPLLTVHAMASYADLPLAFYALLGTVFFWRFIAEREKKFIFISGIFLGMAMIIKNEGLFFAVAVFNSLLFFLLFNKGKKEFFLSVLSFLLPVILIAGPWLIYKASIGLGFGHTGNMSGLDWFSDPLRPGIARMIHWEVLPIALKEIFLRPGFNLVFVFCIFLFVTGFKVILRDRVKYLFIILFQIALMFFFIYLTLEVLAVTRATGFHRNILTYAPVLFLSTALLFSAKRSSLDL